MMADTDAARRPALPARSRRRMSVRALCGALSGVLLLGVAGATLPTPAAQAAESSVELVVGAAAPQLGPGQDLTVSVTVTNTGTQTIDAGTIDVVLDPDRLGTRGELDAWLSPADGAPAPAGELVTIAAPRLLPSWTTTLQATIPAASVGLDGAAWGARGIAALYDADDTRVAEGRGAVTWYAGEAVTPTPLAVVIPLTAPASATGLLSADELTTLTAPGGTLTRQLEDALGQPVALGIDPMVIASIRVLGTSAPESATEWLERLAAAGNETFPLAWADADVAVQAQAGLATLLAPTSLNYAIDPANFAQAPSSPTPTATPTTAAPTSDPVMPLTVPTLEQLLAWPYTETGVAWPAPGTVASGDLATFAASGLDTTIVSSADLADAPPTTPRLAATAVDRPVAVSDARLSAALSRATTAETDAAWRAALAEATAVLAVAAGEASAATPVLAALERSQPTGSGRVQETLAALAGLPWATEAGFSSALAGTPASVTIAAEGEPTERVDVVPQLVAGEAELAAFATALADPSTLTGSERSAVLGLLSVGWLDAGDEFSTALGAHQLATAATLRSVSIGESSEVNVVGSPAQIPVSISNQFSSPVTVHVEAVPSNGRLVVDSGVDVTIEAGSSASVKIPVQAKVGSGRVVLTVSMTSPTGVPIGTSGTVVANVQADWEGLGAAILGVLLVLFFGFGIVRNIRRRRRERVGSADAPAETPTDAPAPAHGDETPPAPDEAPRG